MTVIALSLLIACLAAPTVAHAYYSQVRVPAATAKVRLTNGTYTSSVFVFGSYTWNASSQGLRGYRWVRSINPQPHWEIDYNYNLTTYNGQPCRVFSGPWYDAP